VNAAFLLVTTAWIAGADTAAPAAPTTPPPAAAAPVHSVGTGGCASCGGCTSCGCDTGCEHESLFSKLKARFHRGDCGCDTGCSTCDTCGGHSGGGLREKLRGLFHRGDDCGCNTGCGTCAGCGGVISTAPGTIMPKAEPIGPPKEDLKKLPAGDGKKPGSVQLIPQPISVPQLQVAPTSGKSPF
jgi:hypothetical protein